MSIVSKIREMLGYGNPYSGMESESRTGEAVDVIRMHLEFLDHLSSGTPRDLRMEFLTFYTQRRPDKTLSHNSRHKK